jgi:hypothetical protein
LLPYVSCKFSQRFFKESVRELQNCYRYRLNTTKQFSSFLELFFHTNSIERIVLGGVL